MFNVHIYPKSKTSDDNNNKNTKKIREPTEENILNLNK